MNANIITTLNELLDGSALPSRESLVRLMDEMTGFMRDLKAKFDSQDPQKREEAISDAQELQAVLMSKLGVLADKAGLDLAQMASLMQEPNALSSEDRTLVEEVKGKLEEMQHSHRHARSFALVR